MTTFLLVRHATTDLIGNTLAGRAPDVHLNARGRLEAESLSERLTHLPIRAIYTGPLERTQETAWPLAAKFMIELRVSEGLDEVDCGEWTRKTFAELDPDERWQRWNADRSSAAIPGGETMREVQARVTGTLERLAEIHPDEHVAIVSHGDVIKAALLHFLGASLDRILHFEIAPASVSILTLDGKDGRIWLLNDTAELVPRNRGNRRRRSLT